MGRELNRRDFLRSGIVTVGAVALGPSLWRAAIAAPAEPGDSPYGDLRPADDNGIRLPEGFTAREIARSGTPVVGTALAAPYIWHHFPDGGAVFPSPDDDGWVYVSNSEVPFGGGVGAVRFNPDGSSHSAYRLLAGTSQNCAGGPTPWGTWLSCEEHTWGYTWEVDPFAATPEVAPASQDIVSPAMRPTLGRFQHEAAAVVPDAGTPAVYLTEDQSDGLFYRFIPGSGSLSGSEDLSSGTLQAAEVTNLGAVLAGGSSLVVWHDVPNPEPLEGPDTPTRSQNYGAGQPTVFDGGEGTWFDQGIVYFTTKGDDRVWEYDTTTDEIALLYDADGPLNGVDNIFVSGGSGEIFVAEDHQDPDEALDIVIITPDRQVARLLQVTGPQHEASELAGPILFFDSAEAGHFYFSSQRAYGQGATYEVTGPFNGP